MYPVRESSSLYLPLVCTGIRMSRFHNNVSVVCSHEIDGKLAYDRTIKMMIHTRGIKENHNARPQARQ